MVFVHQLTSVAALSLLRIVYGATVSKTLNITNSLISPDGYQRSAVTAGGTFPGPLITGNTVDHIFTPRRAIFLMSHLRGIRSLSTSSTR
jgi:hypothetical protein